MPKRTASSPKSRGFLFRHDVDMAGVTGSIPVAPTTQTPQITPFFERRCDHVSRREVRQRAYSEQRTPCFLRFSADGKQSEHRHRGDVRDSGKDLGDGRSRRVSGHDSVAGSGLGTSQRATSEQVQPIDLAVERSTRGGHGRQNGYPHGPSQTVYRARHLHSLRPPQRAPAVTPRMPTRGCTRRTTGRAPTRSSAPSPERPR